MIESITKPFPSISSVIMIPPGFTTPIQAPPRISLVDEPPSTTNRRLLSRSHSPINHQIFPIFVPSPILYSLHFLHEIFSMARHIPPTIVKCTDYSFALRVVLCRFGKLDYSAMLFALSKVLRKRAPLSYIAWIRFRSTLIPVGPDCPFVGKIIHIPIK